MIEYELMGHNFILYHNLLKDPSAAAELTAAIGFAASRFSLGVYKTVAALVAAFHHRAFGRGR